MAIWAEIKKAINSNFDKTLDVLINEKHNIINQKIDTIDTNTSNVNSRLTSTRAGYLDYLANSTYGLSAIKTFLNNNKPMKLKYASVTVDANATAVIPVTTDIKNAVALIGTSMYAYNGDTALASWRAGSGNIITITAITDTGITIKGGSTSGGTLYYTYWE
jgi:hypothetical protein